MNPDEIIFNLKKERARLEGLLAEKAREAQALTAEHAKISGAINALEGKLPATVRVAAPSATGPTVSDMVLEIVKGLPANATFDHKALKRFAAVKAGWTDGDKARFKTGVYTAVAWLKKHGRIKLAPGGFQLMDENL